MLLGAGKVGKCPHCQVVVRFEPVQSVLSPKGHVIIKNDYGTGNTLALFSCPNCGQNILRISPSVVRDSLTGMINPDLEQKGHVRVEEANFITIWPIGGSRKAPREVAIESPSIAKDYEEAALILGFSRKASAALSRRCLQHVLIEMGGVTPSENLSKQIDSVLDILPSTLADNIDAVRVLGNFSAHPIKSRNTGEIVDVEEGEAEWLLEVLEDLFEYYYVAPSRAKSRRVALNAKLKEEGRPPLKRSSLKKTD